jgi:hypothetical protein
MDPKVVGSNPGAAQIDFMSFINYTMGMNIGVHQESKHRQQLSKSSEDLLRN